MKKYGILFVLIIVVFFVGFYTGRYPYRKLKFYENNGLKLTYPPDWPYYGLNIMEYSYLLLQLKNGNLKELERRGQFFLDQVLYDAAKRMKVLDKYEKNTLRYSIILAGVLRTIAPRPKGITKKEKIKIIDKLIEKAIKGDPKFYQKQLEFYKPSIEEDSKLTKLGGQVKEK